MDASDIRKIVFKWYEKNKDECDAKYYKLTNNSIYNIYRTVKDDDEGNLLFAKTDIVILTANNFERSALHQFSYDFTKEKIIEIPITMNCAIDFNNSVYAYSFKLSDYSVLHIHSRVTGSYTNGGAADAVRYVLSNQYLFPTAIISFGVCFGTNEENNDLGDIIISEKIYPYFVGAKVNGKELKVRDDNAFVINDELGKKIDNLESKNQFRGMGFNINYGNYITGEAVVSSAEFRQRYTGITTQNIIAGDMEAYGIFRECNTTPYKVPCVVLKAICDWGIEKNFKTNDENVILDYCRLVLKCSDPEKAPISREEIVKTISSLTDRLQAIAASNSFIILKLLLDKNTFKHSAFFNLKEKFITKNFIGVASSSHALKDMSISDLECYGYTINDCFIKAIVSLLSIEGIIYDIDTSKNKEETYDVSFKIVESKS